MSTPAETRKEALILALLIGGLTAIAMTTMVFMSDFLGFYQVKEGQNCPPAQPATTWAGLASPACS